LLGIRALAFLEPRAERVAALEDAVADRQVAVPAFQVSPPFRAAVSCGHLLLLSVVRLDTMDFRLELVQVPVSDVDPAKTFYTEKAGFNADHDFTLSESLRFVQLTPPGSACSIAIGTGLSEMKPGSVEGLQLVVDDIEAARGELAGRGVEVSDVQVFD